MGDSELEKRKIGAEEAKEIQDESEFKKPADGKTKSPTAGDCHSSPRSLSLYNESPHNKHQDEQRNSNQEHPVDCASLNL